MHVALEAFRLGGQRHFGAPIQAEETGLQENLLERAAGVFMDKSGEQRVRGMETMLTAIGTAAHLVINKLCD